MDGWDLALMAIAAFCAVTVLARLMSEHRDATMSRLRRDFEAEQSRLAAERRRQQRLERKRKRLEEKQKLFKELEEKQRRARAG